MHDRFFESTRGKIVGALRERRSASAFDLAQAFGLSPNAIRQQLVVLERDGLVAGHSVRRGKTKPTVEYSLTPEAERYFPQRYDKMLNAVLREIRAAGGDEAVQEVFKRIGQRSAERLAGSGDGNTNPEDQLISLVELLKHSGVTAELQRTEEGTLVLHEHNCPYASVVAENPEACTAIHTILETVAGKAAQVESIATGGDECRFEIDVTSERETATAS